MKFVRDMKGEGEGNVRKHPGFQDISPYYITSCFNFLNIKEVGRSEN